MKRPPLLVPLPEGVPVFVNRLGCYEARPGSLPVSVLHHDWDIFWVRQGVGVWELRSGERLTAGPDELALLPPFTLATTREGRAPLKFWFCHFAFRPLAGPLMDKNRTDRLGPGARALVPLTFSKREAPGVWRAYRRLTQMDVRGSALPWRCEQGLLALVAELARFAQARTARRAPGRLFEPSAVQDRRVTVLRERIAADPAYPWKVTELAESVGLSPGHLHSLCREMLGRSLKRYLVETRLRHAVKLLQEQSGGRLPSIKEVSAACGFSSQHFFSRQFKGHFGFGPRACREGTAWP